MQFETLQSLAALSVARGITRVIISPGSRSAPVAVAFHRQPGCKTLVVNDERSAGYIGLGMAQSLDQPVILICTSGTAAVNYSPAVAEAFFQHVPLIILTADRPPEFLGRGDGQMVFQKKLYGRHVKHAVQLPVYAAKVKQQAIEEDFSTAITKALEPLPGPVHCNVPIAEPFYQELQSQSSPPVPAITPAPKRTQVEQLSSWSRRLAQYRRVLILVTQRRPDQALNQALKNVTSVPVILECTSNISGSPAVLRQPDILFRRYKHDSYAALKPDLLITVGENVISRPMKTVLRNWQGYDHWHIQESGTAADVYFSNPEVVPADPAAFFSHVFRDSPEANITYFERWKTEYATVQKRLSELRNQKTALNEYLVTAVLLNNLPENSVVHLGNSMPVRWANLCPVPDNIAVYSNRGTSGIDGVLSTAVGHALAQPVMHYVLLGDISFFYDRNAFWLKTIPDNLRIIVLNNQGGGIFSLIDGPSQLPELNELFVTYQTGQVRSVADEYHLGYRLVDQRSGLKRGIQWITEQKRECRILEVKVAIRDNKTIFQYLMQTDEK